jgi:hypothetical protein
LLKTLFDRAWKWALAVALVLSAVAVTILVSFPEVNYPAGYMEGVAKARNDLAHGTAVNLFFGLPQWNEMLDRETGLQNQTTGCIVDERIMGYVAAYRKTVSDYIAEHGLPLNSRKKWESILFNLRRYYRDRAAGAQPAILEVDHSVSSPNGQATISLRINPASPDIPSAYLVGTLRRGTEEPVEWSAYPMGPENRRLELLWGPDGADFALLHGMVSGTDGKAYDLYGALDLRTGTWLRYEVPAAEEPQTQP